MGRGAFAGHTLYIGSQAFAVDDAIQNEVTGQLEWVERGFDAGASARLELLRTGRDEEAPIVTGVYTLADGLELIVEISEALANDARDLTDDEVAAFSLHDAMSKTHTSFATGELASAQTVEDETGNHGLLDEHDRDTVRVLRLMLPDAAPIKAEAFVTLEYDDAGGLADTAGTGLEAFDGQSITNYSAAGMQEGESQLGVEPPTVTAIEAALPTDGQGEQERTRELLDSPSHRASLVTTQT